MTTETATGHVEALARRLADVRRTFRPIADLPADLIPPDVATAYRVDARVEQLLGWEPLGWKIAATTPAMQARLESCEPVRGRTYARHRHSSPAVLKMSELNGPMVECEFFMTLGRDLPLRDADWTEAEVAAAVRDIHAGIEVAETRYVIGRRPGVTGLIADGSSAGQYVFGDRLPFPPDRLSDIPVVLYVDGVAEQQGHGSDVLGNPVRALVWLANHLGRAGRSLKAGEVISTGSVTGVYYARPDCLFRVEFGSHGAVEIRFEP